MERKILGSLHFRLGPDKVGFYAILQPFSDAIKLFRKDSFKLKFYQEFLWNFSPVSLLLIIIFIIYNLPIKDCFSISNTSFIIILLLISISLFPFLFSGIISFRKYSILGSYRCVVQILSYEIIITFLFIFLIVVNNSINFSMLINIGIYSGIIKINFFFFGVLFLFEIGRTPFDFIEGESELVSGFNTEFWGPYFSTFFIYEYGILVILSSLISLITFFRFRNIVFFLVLFFIVLIRASFPRYRYDLIISFIWKHIFFLFSLILISNYIII